MEDIVIEAEPRETFGKGPNRRLRSRGLIPAIVYGEKKEAIPVAIDPRDVTRILRSHSGINTIFQLSLKDGSVKDNVMIREYQLEPVEHTLLHADLVRVAMDHVMTVTVPLELMGTPVGVKQQGGVLDFVTRNLELTCLPGDIPDQIEVDVSALAIGDLIRVGDLALPERVTLESDREVVVAHVLAPRVEEVAEEEAAAEEAEAAEAGAEPELIKRGRAEEEEEGSGE